MHSGSDYVQRFDEIFKAEGLHEQKLPRQSRNLNAYAERWIQSIKREALDNFVVFEEDHLNHLVQEYVAHFQACASAAGESATAEAGRTGAHGTARYRPDRVPVAAGGLLKHYERRAA